MTLASLVSAGLGIFLAASNFLTLAIVLMVLSMLIDMLDGMLARKYKLESGFGRQLDSFCDVFTYLVLPLFILYQFGMKDALSIILLFIFLTCGLLRLSRFNVEGTVERDGIQYHLGLQVFWSQIVVVLVFPVWHWSGSAARYLMFILLPSMSGLMIMNILVPKPTRYRLLSILILSTAAIFTFLHLRGVYTP
jgi:CDP-diacylglycerol--serine O-phosphatidyltransferase